MPTSSEYVDRLGKASRPIKGAILGGVLLLLGGLYYYLIYSDMSADYNSASQAKSRLRDDEQRLIRRQGDYEKLIQQKKEAEERLQTNAIKLPEASEVPAVFRDVDAQAATANVRVVSRTVEKEVPIESYVKVPVHMEVAGTFWELNQYFKLLSETKRIITIENLNIGNGVRVGDHLELSARFTASTFRQADKAAIVAPTQQGPTDAPPTPGPPPGQPGQPPASPASAPAPAPGAVKIVENPAGAPPSAPPIAPPAPASAPSPLPAPAPAPGGGK